MKLKEKTGGSPSFYLLLTPLREINGIAIFLITCKNAEQCLLKKLLPKQRAGDG
jgi:hypothetical protein